MQICSRLKCTSGDCFHFGLLELLDSFPITSTIFVLTKTTKMILLFWIQSESYILPPPPPCPSRLCRLSQNLLLLPLKFKLIEKIYIYIKNCIWWLTYFIVLLQNLVDSVRLHFAQDHLSSSASFKNHVAQDWRESCERRLRNTFGNICGILLL